MKIDRISDCPIAVITAEQVLGASPVVHLRFVVPERENHLIPIN